MVKTKRGRVPVSKRAVLARVNRRLRMNGELLKRSRGRYAADIGDYYVLDVGRNFIVRKHVDLESLAREIDALADYEQLTDG
jgi:hypothetical protein